MKCSYGKWIPLHMTLNRVSLPKLNTLTSVSLVRYLQKSIFMGVFTVLFFELNFTLLSNSMFQRLIIK